MDRSDWKAYVTEEMAGEDTWEWDPAIAAGTFRAWIEQWPPPPDGEYPSRDCSDEVAGLALADCVAWANERAARIEVSVIPEEHYSAGDDPIAQLPLLPEGFDVARRRNPGYAYLDRTAADSAIEWDVIIEATIDTSGRNGWEGTVTDVHERWRTALGSHGCTCLEMISSYASPFAVHSPDGQPGGWAAPEAWPVAVVRLEASHLDAARAATAAAANGAAVEIGWPTTPFRSGDGYPTGSKLAGWNAHVG